MHGIVQFSYQETRTMDLWSSHGMEAVCSMLTRPIEW